MTLTQFSRRGLLAAGAALASVTALAACSTTTTSTGSDGGRSGTAGSSGSSGASGATDAFPVTVEHAYGRTVIEAEPTRVATLGWVDQDHVLALGVVPVGATEISWGGNAAGSTPWFDEELERLGGEQPVRYSDTDGAPVEEIAALAPDLVLATNSGLTQEEYDTLSDLAPVVAFPDEPWLTSWQDSLELVGAALGRSEQAEEVREQAEQVMAQTAEENPQLPGTSFIFASLTTADTSKIDYYTPADNRALLLEELGMVNAPVIERISKPGQFYGTLSAERAPELRSDVFITYAEQSRDLAVFEDDPLLGRIPGIATGHVVAATDKTEALGMSSPSPLSIPYAMSTFVPEVAEAVSGA